MRKKKITGGERKFLKRCYNVSPFVFSVLSTERVPELDVDDAEEARRSRSRASIGNLGSEQEKKKRKFKLLISFYIHTTKFPIFPYNLKHIQVFGTRFTFIEHPTKKKQGDRLQIRYKVVCISLCSNALGEKHETRQIGFFKLSEVNGLEILILILGNRFF